MSFKPFTMSKDTKVPENFNFYINLKLILMIIPHGRSVVVVDGVIVVVVVVVDVVVAGPPVLSNEFKT